LNGFGHQKLTKNGLKSVKKVLRKRFEKKYDFETDFEAILDRFWASI